MPETTVNIDLGDQRNIEITTGKIANLANGSCTLRLGDTILLVAACSGKPRAGTDFFPLQVDYREKFSAAGRFPGGYFKREGRPSTKEILTCRMSDRPVRPLFPDGFFHEVQIQALLLSADGINDSDVLCVLGTSVALALSDMPFKGPIGALRVGYVDGKFIANPTHEEMVKSEIDLIYAGLPDKVIMIEGDANECSEDLLKQAMDFANEIVKKQVAAQNELVAQAGRPKKEYPVTVPCEKLTQAVEEFCASEIETACLIPGKEDRQNALDDLFERMKESFATKFENDTDFSDEKKLDFLLGIACDKLVQKTVRNAILNKGYRPDGRTVEDLRPLSAEVDVLPCVHGSGLFSRGETQALVVTTLGAIKDSQESDVITGGEGKKSFYLHYNFPNYSVGETGRIMGPGRRETGHGNLAERSIAKVIPQDFPYTVRCVSEIMASNGSTSMASVCGASLSLMDAGVPITGAVAGISCGLIQEDGKDLLLTDILGMEDHFGDMDFKISGTRKGITAFQLDLKLPGISLDLLCQGMMRNRDVRMKILDTMDTCMPSAREEISPRAPQIRVVKINPEKIGALIGPGGKNIRELTDRTKSEIDIEDDGTVHIFACEKSNMDEALKSIEALTAEAEIDKVYRGKVTTVKDFGAFVEIFPGQEGLLHISEMANYRVGKVTDICNEGDAVTVKVIDIDGTGRIRLSRKAALDEMES